MALESGRYMETIGTLFCDHGMISDLICVSQAG